MGLTQLGFATESIQTSNGSFDVRGLALDDIIRLTRAHGEALAVLFSRVLDGGQAEDLSLDDISKISGVLSEAAPEIVADIIALAADEPTPEGVAVARKLPFPTQVAALEKIGELTFSQEGGPKKVMETVIKVLKGVSDLVLDMRT